MSHDLLVFGSINRHYNTLLPATSSADAISESSSTIECRVTARTLGDDEDCLALVHLPLRVFEEIRCISGALVELRRTRAPARAIVAKAVVLEAEGGVQSVGEIPPTVAWALGELSFRSLKLAVTAAAQIAPLVATEVRLARVVTADSDGSENYAAAIARFFKIPRLLRQGDIVPVAVTDLDVAGNDGGKNHSGNGNGNGGSSRGARLQDPLITRMRVVYFQVSSVVARGATVPGPAVSASAEPDAETSMLFEVSRRHTTLVQQSAVQIVQPDHLLVEDMMRRYIERHLPRVHIYSAHAGLLDRRLVSAAFSNVLEVLCKFCELSLSATGQVTARQHLQQLRLLVETVHTEDMKMVAEFAAAKLGIDVRIISLRQLIGHTDIPSQQLIQACGLQLLNVAPCLLVLTDIDEVIRSGSQRESADETDSRIAEVLTQLWEALHHTDNGSECRTASIYLWNHTARTVVTVGVAGSLQVLGPRTRALFAQEFALPGMTTAAVLECANQAWGAGVSLSAPQVQKLTRTLVGRSVTDGLLILSEAMRLATAQAGAEEEKKHQAEDLSSFLQACAEGNVDLRLECSPVDLLSAASSSVLLREQRTMAKSSIPDVKWQDIGGLDYVRHEIIQTMEMPLKYPELFGPSVPRRRAILLYGPPGTGKTLVAKAVATECDMNFISVKGPELLDMYVGESERNVRLTFEEARKNAPCVLFFDELDSLAPKRGRGSDAGGVMDRVVSQLLSEMDALATEPGNNKNDLQSAGQGSLQHAGIFVIAATNRPDLLDPSLLRPGRFDRKLYLGTNQTMESRLGVLKAQTRKFCLHQDVDLAAIAELLPINTTGADIGSLTSQAYMTALNRKLQGLEDALRLRNEQDHYGAELSMTSFLEGLDSSEFKVVVTQQDLQDAARNLQPSVSLAELHHYERLKEQFSDA